MTDRIPSRCLTHCRSLTIALTMAACLAHLAFGADDEDRSKGIADHERWVTAAAFSADDSVLATVGQSLQYRPGDVQLWDATSGSLLASLEGHSSNVWSVAISPDGTTMITSGYDGKVIIWNVVEKKSTAVLEKHTGWCRSVAFSPDGEHFATAGEDGNVVIWTLSGPSDAMEIKEVKEIKVHESAVYQVAFSPDGETLATASTDKNAKLWDWESAKELACLEGHEDAVWAVAFSKDGRLIATAGADRMIKLWDAEGVEKTTLVGHKDWVTSIDFSPDGKQLVAADYGRGVKQWDVEQAMTLGEEVTQAVAELKAQRSSAAEATKKEDEGQAQLEKLQKEATAIEAIADARLLPEELKQAEAALQLAQANRFFQKAVEQAKVAAEAATKAAEEQTKAVEDDKELSEKLKGIQAGPLEDARREKANARKAADETEAQVKAAQETRAKAEAAAAELEQKTRTLSERLFTPLGEFDSSVWAVAFSSDGKRIATGSHTGLQVWDLATGQELFPRSTE